jgi:hypothetical protein
MVNGITTVISSSVVTEKIADTQGKAAENNQLANTVAVQDQARLSVSTVQKVTKTENARKTDDKNEKQKKKQKQPDEKSGNNLDLEA